MKKQFLLILSIAASLGTYAQKGIDSDSRFGHGQDSIDCLSAITVYQANLQNNNFADAYPYWKEVFTNFPIARVDTYPNGVKILKGLIAKETDEAKKKAYSTELMQIHDQHINHLDKLQEITTTPLSKGNILGRRAMDYISFSEKASLDSAYALLSEAINMEKGMTEYIVTQQFMNISAQKYKKSKEHGEQIIQDYLDASTYIVEVLDKYNERIEFYSNKYKELMDPKDSIRSDGFGKMIDAARIARNNIDAYFINSGAASCEDLDTIYNSKIEENKDNIAYLEKVIGIMDMLKCTNQNAYLSASEYALAIKPTSKAAMGCGYRYFKKGEIDKAMELFEQAIEHETSMTTKAELCYKVGFVYLSQKQYAKARSLAQQAIALNSKYGMPYILIAQCYAGSPNWHNDATLNRCTYFAAIDKLQRAKAVDPSVANDANKYISSYSTYTPKAEDLFFLGYSKGQSITIGGWINETTTIR